MFKTGYCGATIEKSPRIVSSNSGSFLNTTQDESAGEESPSKFVGGIYLSPMKKLEDSDEEQHDQENEDLDVSLSSLGLDFV